MKNALNLKKQENVSIMRILTFQKESRFTRIFFDDFKNLRTMRRDVNAAFFFFLLTNRNSFY